MFYDVKDDNLSLEVLSSEPLVRTEGEDLDLAADVDLLLDRGNGGGLSLVHPVLHAKLGWH
jgi:hypothetical protein